MSKCLVTVGTTKFPKLMKALREGFEGVIAVLKSGGVEGLTVQFGTEALGVEEEKRLKNLGETKGVRVEFTDFIPMLNDKMRLFDVVVSHAGD